MQLQINPKNDSISLSINGKKNTHSTDVFKNSKSCQIVFGKSNLPDFSLSDVCPMSIRDIEIQNHKNKHFGKWPLGKHTIKNTVYDKTQGRAAIATNPVWLIDKHIDWYKETDFKFNDLIGIAKDELQGHIFFIDTKAIYKYGLQTHTLDTIFYTGSPYPCQANTLVYHDNKLYSYNFDEANVSTFDFKSKKWSVDSTDCKETAYWHHNKIFSPEENSIYTFGGYGHFKYKGLLKKLDLTNNTWSEINLSQTIEPRYLSSLGTLDPETLLVFGGYGSKTGRQELSTQNYYNLFKINLKDKKAKYLWEIDPEKNTPFTTMESMVISENSNQFYTLIFDSNSFNTQLRLTKFNINDGEMTVFADSIPYNFKDTNSYGSFFLNNTNKTLYTVTQHDGNVNLYSLSYPPLLETDVLQHEPGKTHLYLLYIIVGLILLTLIYYLAKKRKKVGNGVALASNRSPKDYILSYKTEPKLKKSSVFLFGGLQVFDEGGNDITAMFTPTIKYLFLLIIFHTYKNGKGISSANLTKHLWFDKSDSRANNNRNVNINKLRHILEKIGNIEIVNDNTYWKINIGEGVFCDYAIAYNLLNKKLTDEDTIEINTILLLAEPGVICPDINEEWIDPFRVGISDKILDTLNEIVTKSNDNELISKAIDTILIFDSLNEDALKIKCKLLYDEGKKTQAKHFYDSFCEKYHDLLNAEFDTSFYELVGDE